MASTGHPLSNAVQARMRAGGEPRRASDIFQGASWRLVDVTDMCMTSLWGHWGSREGESLLSLWTAAPAAGHCLTCGAPSPGSRLPILCQCACSQHSPAILQLVVLHGTRTASTLYLVDAVEKVLLLLFFVKYVKFLHCNGSCILCRVLHKILVTNQ